MHSFVSANNTMTYAWLFTDRSAGIGRPITVHFSYSDPDGALSSAVYDSVVGDVKR